MSRACRLGNFVSDRRYDWGERAGLQMNTWPTAPQIAKPRTSYQTPGCLLMKPNAAANSPPPPEARSIPRYSPIPVWTKYGERARYVSVRAVDMILLAHIICGPLYGLKVWKI